MIHKPVFKNRILFILFFVLFFVNFVRAEEGTWETAQLSTVPLTEEVVGTLKPKTVTTLSSKVMGNVLEVLKREGDLVEPGEILVKIDAKEIRSDLAGAHASISEAQAVSSEVRSLIKNAEAAKQAAQHELNLAKVSFQRIKELYDKKSVTQQEYDQANTRYLQANSQLTQASAQISGLEAKLSQTAAKSRQAQAGLSKVNTIKDLAEVRSPFFGRIISRKVEPGMLAAPGVPLMVLEDIGGIRFEAIVPERLLSFLPEGATIPIRIDAVGEDSFPGTVVEIVPGADPLSHTFTVKLSIPDDVRFHNGMYARGTVNKGEEKVMLIPASAVERRGQLEGVVVKSGQKRIYRLIKTGKSFGDRIEVLSGLNSGDVFSLQPGDRELR